MILKVSVIVPVYNSEKHLRECLDSLVNQTLKDLEVIVIDDASTDKSFEIIMEYKNRYPEKIKVFKNEQNKGQGASRNVGLSLATGAFIGFLDSDDYVTPTMYEELYNNAINNKADIVSTRLTFVKDNSYLGKTFESYNQETSYNPLENPNLVLDESPSVCNKLFKKKFLQDQTFLEDCIWEDVAFTYANLFNASKVVHLNNMGYFYRKSSTEGVSAKGFKVNPNLLDTFKVADRLEEDTKKSGRYEILKESVRYMQIVTTLQRASEVLAWDIPESIKEIIIYHLHKLIYTKYGDWRNMDLATLSMRVGILELEKIKDIVKKYETLESEKKLEKPTLNITKIVQDLENNTVKR